MEPIAAKNMMMTNTMMLTTFAQKSKLVFFGFMTTSQMTLGIQKVMGANPKAPKNPSRSADRPAGECQCIHKGIL